MLSGAASALLPPIMALGLAVAVMTLAAQLLLGEGGFVPGNLAFKGSRINPISGLKRMFGLNALIELGKGLLKVILLGLIAWGWAGIHVPELMAMEQADLRGQIEFGLEALTSLIGVLLVGLFVGLYFLMRGAGFGAFCLAACALLALLNAGSIALLNTKGQRLFAAL